MTIVFFYRNDSFMKRVFRIYITSLGILDKIFNFSEALISKFSFWIISLTNPHSYASWADNFLFNAFKIRQKVRCSNFKIKNFYFIKQKYFSCLNRWKQMNTFKLIVICVLEITFKLPIIFGNVYEEQPSDRFINKW